jgi:hypothetical protein
MSCLTLPLVVYRGIISYLKSSLVVYRRIMSYLKSSLVVYRRDHILFKVISSCYDSPYKQLEMTLNKT